jgi:hypothetical protein
VVPQLKCSESVKTMKGNFLDCTSFSDMVRCLDAFYAIPGNETVTIHCAVLIANLKVMGWSRAKIEDFTEDARRTERASQPWCQ